MAKLGGRGLQLCWAMWVCVWAHVCTCACVWAHVCTCACVCVQAEEKVWRKLTKARGDDLQGEGRQGSPGPSSSLAPEGRAPGPRMCPARPRTPALAAEPPLPGPAAPPVLGDSYLLSHCRRDPLLAQGPGRGLAAIRMWWGQGFQLRTVPRSQQESSSWFAVTESQ